VKYEFPCDETTGYLRIFHFFEKSNPTLIRSMSFACHKVQQQHFFDAIMGLVTLVARYKTTYVKNFF